MASNITNTKVLLHQVEIAFMCISSVIHRMLAADSMPPINQYRPVRRNSCYFPNVISNFYTEYHFIYCVCILECGGNFTIVQGNITSPNYPNNYEPHTHCQVRKSAINNNNNIKCYLHIIESFFRFLVAITNGTIAFDSIQIF